MLSSTQATCAQSSHQQKAPSWSMETKTAQEQQKEQPPPVRGMSTTKTKKKQGIKNPHWRSLSNLREPGQQKKPKKIQHFHGNPDKQVIISSLLDSEAEASSPAFSGKTVTSSPGPWKISAELTGPSSSTNSTSVTNTASQTEVPQNVRGKKTSSC